MPPLDINQISSIWDKILPNPKTMFTVTEEIWELASKATIIPFSIFMSMFHHLFMEHRFLESALELLQQFTFKTNQLHMIIRYFLGINPSSVSSVFIVEKKIYRINWKASSHCTHGYLSSFENVVIDPSSPLIFKNMPVLFTSTRKYSASKTLFDNAIYERAGDNADELFHSKKCCTSHDCRIGEYCFCEATKVDLAESEGKC
jgi:hypothetical protein